MTKRSALFGVFGLYALFTLTLTACPPATDADAPTQGVERPVRAPITVAPATSTAKKKGPRPTETALSKAKSVTLAAGAKHACAIRADGSAACWGSNDQGQFGRDPFDGAIAAVPVKSFDNTLELVAGDLHTCGRRQGGDVVCFGDDSTGQLGHPEGKYGQAVTFVNDALGLAAGSGHSCALVTGNKVACWGKNDKGQLGDGTTAPSTREPRAVVGLVDVVEVAAGGDQTCARRANGTVACWGLGATAPVDVKGVTDASALGVSSTHACAVHAKSSGVACWGDNAQGQLGGGVAPGPAAGLVETRGIVDASEVALSDRATCVRAVTGEVWCFGDGASTPKPIGRGVRQLVAGRAHFCAIQGKGGVVCWGDNNGGQLGEGFPSIPRVEPVKVQGLFDEG